MKSLILFRRMLYLFLILSGFNTAFSDLFSQPAQQLVEVLVAPDHPDWLYRLGEKPEFEISVLKNNVPLQNITITYSIGPELMSAWKSGTETIRKENVVLKSESMKKPGFLRCTVKVEVEGKQYEGMATVGFEPEKISGTAREPSDFQMFWNKAKNELSDIPMDARVRLLPDRCTEKVNVYELNLQNYPLRSRIYGILAVPKATGKYPAVLRVPGAGVRPYYGDIDTAEQGIITLQIGIHGIPVTLEPHIYENLRYGALNDYWIANLNDPDEYYFKRVYLGCLRALDYLTQMPEFDGANLAVAGGSQGGALSVVTAGLDQRVKWIVPFFPALSDVTGYLEDRAGGWPHMFSNPENRTPENIATAGYYDVVNFARHLKAESYFSWGFNDLICPPTSMHAVYNVIQAPKQLMLAPATGHWSFPEQRETTEEWLVKKLKGQ